MYNSLSYKEAANKLSFLCINVMQVHKVIIKQTQDLLDSLSKYRIKGKLLIGFAIAQVLYYRVVNGILSEPYQFGIIWNESKQGK